MPAIECPDCGTRVDAPASGTASCPSCGFSAPVGDAAGPTGQGAQATTGSTHDRDAAAGPTSRVEALRNAEEESPAEQPGPWAYLLGVTAFLTFWLASIGVPFLLGAGAVVLGIIGLGRRPRDRRAAPAIALGGVAIVAALVFLLV